MFQALPKFPMRVARYEFAVYEIRASEHAFHLVQVRVLLKFCVLCALCVVL